MPDFPRLPGIECGQRPEELLGLIDWLRPQQPKTYCEIGAKHGGSLYAMAKALGLARVTAVDLPGGPWGHRYSRDHLKAVAAALVSEGIEVDLVLRNSQDERTLSRALRGMSRGGPAPWPVWDVMLIDGDHRLWAVLEDFGIWARHARHVVLHDIAARGDYAHKSGMPMGVPAAWARIGGMARSEGLLRREFVGPASNMGLGVLTNECERSAKKFADSVQRIAREWIV